MNFSVQQKLLFRSRRVWLSGLVMMPIILLMDVPLGGHSNWQGQLAGSALAWIYLGYAYSQVSRRFQKAMALGLIWALIGEVILAFGLDMYAYRFGNIPLYVPPGHVAAMIVSYQFVREPWVQQHRRQIEAVLLAASAIFCTTWLVLQNDVYGFALFFPFLAILAVAKESRTFFLVIFAVTTYMELIGTSLGCWRWASTLMGRYPALPGGNPPSGIVFLYLFFDVAVLGSYFCANLKIRSRYDRRKAWRRAQKKSNAPEPSPLGALPQIGEA